MNKKFVLGALVLAIGLATVYGVYEFQTNRISPERLRAMREAERRVTDADKEELVLAKADAAEATPEEKPATEPAAEPAEAAPANAFDVKFETEKGDFVVRFRRDWAPIGTARVEELVKSGYYDNAAFFRVVPGFVVQFGLAANPADSLAWIDKKLAAETPKASNKRGTVSFAMGRTPDTRSVQLFINLGDNTQLDTMSGGFAPVGEVVKGMDVVERLESKYGEGPTPQQSYIINMGNQFLQAQYPDLDYIKKASIVSEGAAEAPAPATEEAPKGEAAPKA